MSRGKYLSLEEARNGGKIRQFAKEHPSCSMGNRFERLLDVVTTCRPEARQTSPRGDGDDCSDTQTPSRTSQGTS